MSQIQRSGSTAERLGADRPIRVLCVDDNELVVEAVSITLSSHERYTWLGHLSEATDLLETVRERQPDIILLDIDMPGKDALGVLFELSKTYPDLRVIVFTGLISDDLLDRAFAAGAWGYVCKSEGPASIASAIDRVAQGEFAVGLPSRRVRT